MLQTCSKYISIRNISWRKSKENRIRASVDWVTFARTAFARVSYSVQLRSVWNDLDEWISLELNKKWIKKVSICIKKIAHIKKFHTLRGINKTFITVWAVVCFLWLSGCCMLEWCHKIWSRCFHCFYKISSFWILLLSLLFFKITTTIWKQTNKQTKKLADVSEVIYFCFAPPPKKKEIAGKFQKLYFKRRFEAKHKSIKNKKSRLKLHLLTKVFRKHLLNDD